MLLAMAIAYSSDGKYSPIQPFCLQQLLVTGALTSETSRRSINGSVVCVIYFTHLLFVHLADQRMKVIAAVLPRIHRHCVGRRLPGHPPHAHPVLRNHGLCFPLTSKTAVVVNCLSNLPHSCHIALPPFARMLGTLASSPALSVSSLLV